MWNKELNRIIVGRAKLQPSMGEGKSARTETILDIDSGIRGNELR